MDARANRRRGGLGLAPRNKEDVSAVPGPLPYGPALPALLPLLLLFGCRPERDILSGDFTPARVPAYSAPAAPAVMQVAAAAAAAPAGSDEEDAGNGRVVFDGDAARLKIEAVVARMAPPASRTTVLYTGPAREDTLRVGEPPVPDAEPPAPGVLAALRQAMVGRGMISGQIFDKIVAKAAQLRIDTFLALGLAQTESSFNPHATSQIRDKKTGQMVTGAHGVMQVMPQTGARFGYRSVAQLRQVDNNVDAGLRYFRLLLDRFGRVDHALAGYNAGEGAVERYGGIPPYAETRGHVRKSLSFREYFQHLARRASSAFA